MKKFFLFLLTTAFFAAIWSWALERAGFMRPEERTFSARFTETDGETALEWTAVPSAYRYEVEVLCRTTGRLAGGAPFHRVASVTTDQTSFRLPPTTIPMAYRVTPLGLSGPLGDAFGPFWHPRFSDPPAPKSVFRYTEENPASLKPYLVWHPVPGAVCYELELLSAPPEAEGGTRLSKTRHLFSTQRIYTNGYQADLSAFQNQPGLRWRVRALTLQKAPIGEFSPSEPIFVDRARPVPDAPLVNVYAKMLDEYPLLYPVYQWIPLNGITRYEVELLAVPPGDAYPRAPHPARAWYRAANDSFTCYDEYARPDAGVYYWRVRAVDENGRTIGRYSDAASFVVPDIRERPYAAACGDSITHGGGALSYAPSNREYNYMTYLDFPALNLGHSGDTARTTLLHFDDDVLPFRPYNLLILTGSNDLRSARPARDIIDDLARVREKCEANDIRPIFLTLMPIHPGNIRAAFGAESDEQWRAKLEEINRFIRSQPYAIDLEPHFYDASRTVLDPDLAVDGLHPDIPGKMLMAEIINANRAVFREP